MALVEIRTKIETFKSHHVEVLYFWTSLDIFLTEIVGLYINLNLYKLLQDL